VEKGETYYFTMENGLTITLTLVDNILTYIKVSGGFGEVMYSSCIDECTLCDYILDVVEKIINEVNVKKAEKTIDITIREEI